MKNTTMIGLSAAIFGIIIGWVAHSLSDRQDETQKGQEKTSANENRSSRRASSSPSRTPASRIPSEEKNNRKTVVIDPDDILDGTSEEAKEFEKQKQVMVGKVSDKFQATIASLTQDLGLNTQQANALKAYYNDILSKLSSMSVKDMLNDDGFSSLLAPALRGNGLSEALSDHLSEDQKAALKSYVDRQQSAKVESAALKRLAKYQQKFSLTPDQKEKVYDLIYKEATDNAAHQSDRDFVDQALSPDNVVHLESDEFNVGSLVARKYPEIMKSGDHDAMMRVIKLERDNLVKRRIEQMSAILDQGQLLRYRNYLDEMNREFNEQYSIGDDE